MSNIRPTHSVARLEVSIQTFDEIALKLRAAGYDHAFVRQPGKHHPRIDLNGLALERRPCSSDNDGDGTCGRRGCLECGGPPPRLEVPRKSRKYVPGSENDVGDDTL